MHCNSAALRLWGKPADWTPDGSWDGFAELRSLAGEPVAAAMKPAALAASGVAPLPTEFIARSADGHASRVVIHAKTIQDARGNPVGAVCCVTDVSEKRKLQEQASAGIQSRCDFLAMLSHELRNPLSPIMSVATLLQKRSGDPGVVKMAAIVERQAKQLSRFVGDLLDASRLECLWPLQVDARECSVDEVLRLSLDAVEADVLARQQRLLIQGDDRDALLVCDPERVAQALGNVLANASAFTPDGGEFHLRAFVHDRDLRLEVVDFGSGIASADMPHIFRPFERRAVPEGRAPMGAGLGLAIAQGVCEAHGGAIEARSEGPGFGATVSMSLPVVEPAV